VLRIRCIALAALRRSADETIGSLAQGPR